MKKKYIYLLLVGLFSGQLTVLAQQPNKSRKVIANVEIQSDTTITVRSLFGADCKLYGDKIIAKEDQEKELSSEDGTHTETKEYKIYGGDGARFTDRIKELNKDNSRYINRNEQNDISISLIYDDLPDDSLKLSFYGAVHDGDSLKEDGGWCPNKQLIYIVKVKKLQHIEKQGEISYETLGIALAILIIICLIIVILIRIYRLKKRIDSEVNKPSRKSEDIDIDKIRQTVISKINSTDLVQRISNDDIYNLINKSDIQQYIQSVIVGRAKEYLRNRVNVPTPPVVETPVQSTNIAQPALRTTKIEYQSDNNSFVISENSSNKIFEIYSSNGEYYYTIVNDPPIRKEMLGFITAFAKYVETRQDSPIPSTVEVIRDGHLIKNGDKYIVDVNCLLQVSLR